jgi:hypothetical protein
MDSTSGNSFAAFHFPDSSVASATRYTFDGYQKAGVAVIYDQTVFVVGKSNTDPKTLLLHYQGPSRSCSFTVDTTATGSEQTLVGIGVDEDFENRKKIPAPDTMLVTTDPSKRYISLLSIIDKTARLLRGRALPPSGSYFHCDQSSNTPIGNG